MDFIKQNKLTIGVTVVVALAAIVYFMYFSGGSSAPTLSSSTSSTVSQTLLVQLQSLTTIKLDNSVFSNPVFISLTDFGVTIPPENSGRTDPFLPTFSSAPKSGGASLTLPTTK